MPAKILTVAQQKGGAGKTTLVAHLAVAWSARGRRVALIDIDPQASLATWHRRRAQRAAGDAAPPLHLSAIAGWRVATEIDRLGADFDLILIDSPPHAATEARIAVRAADLVLVPVQPSPLDVWATGETLALAAAAKVTPLVVLNRVPPRGRVVASARKILAEMALPVAAAELGSRVAFAASMAEGKGVTEFAPRSPAAQEILGLVAEIAAALGD